MHLYEDCRFALRTSRRTPTVTAAAIITLALGIGVTTAIFSVLRSVVLDQLPYRAADRLVSITIASSDPRGRVSVWLLNEWKARATTVDAWSAFDDSQFLLHASGEYQVFRGMRVSAALFDMLGVAPAHGRSFTPDDERAAEEVIILTDHLWRSRFRPIRASSDACSTPMAGRVASSECCQTPGADCA